MDAPTETLREVLISVQEVFRSELKLAKAEVRETGRVASRHLRRIVISGVVMMLSIPPFIAFCVIGLGRLLDNRYWLSSLIVSVIFVMAGGLSARTAIKRLQSEDFKPHRTLDTATRELEMMERKLHEITEAARKPQLDHERHRHQSHPQQKRRAV